MSTEYPESSIIVSLIGLPVSIVDSNVWKTESRQTFALLLPDLTVIGSLQAIIDAFDSGKIACALVLTPEAEINAKGTHFLVTRENIREVLGSSPEVFGFDSLRK